MASINIPCNDDEVGDAAASKKDVGMTTTQPLAGSSYTLGDRQDRVPVSYTHLTLPTIFRV